MSNKKISEGIVLDCVVFNESIGADKDLVLVNYSDFDLEATAASSNRQINDSSNNLRGLTDIFLKEGAIQHIFEGTDYSVVPTVTPEVREDGNLWYTHNLAFTVYSKKAKDRETLITLSSSKVIAVTKDRSTGLYELFGMYQGLRVTGIDRTYVGAQNSNFYQVTIATPDINVIKEPSLSELSVNLDGVGGGTSGGGGVEPPVPGVYGDATPTVQGLVRVDTLSPNPIVYTVESADFKFEEKNNKVTTKAQLETNKTSIVKYASLKAIVDWIVERFQTIITLGETTQYYRGDKTWQTLDKTAVGLDQVDNTSDADKPMTDEVRFALEGKADLVDGPVPLFGVFQWIARGTNHTGDTPIAGDIFRGAISVTEYSDCMVWNGIGVHNNTNLANFDIKNSTEVAAIFEVTNVSVSGSTIYFTPNKSGTFVGEMWNTPNNGSQVVGEAGVEVAMGFVGVGGMGTAIITLVETGETVTVN